MSKLLTSEIVAEAVRFSALALRHKAAEIEQAALGASSPAEALAAVADALGADSLLELAEPLQRVAEGLPLYPGSIADALEGFGQDAHVLRAMLAEHEAAAAE